uniref:Reverse transcriptase domain-containing protein n=1 Tax=Clytia hemisphaerica TaxID=252671 RepID=A0A7M5X7U7_9CNID
MPLSEESQLKATFTTPFGRYCPTRAPFGLTSMPEIFSKKMDEVVEGLEGVIKSMDDFLVYGKNVQEHDENLDRLFKKLEEYNVTLNEQKCKFRRSEVEFLGHLISAEGIKPLASKIESIIEFPTPTCITELRSFFGMAQQLARFSPKFSKTAEPLRDLLSKKNDWLWTPVHENAFQEIKTLLSSPPILAHYNCNRETKIRTDCSKKNGLSVILFKKFDNEWRLVDSASRWLSPEEKNYFPIEIEMLGVAWGCVKMGKYLQGLPNFLVETDHKPLIPILNSIRHVTQNSIIENEVA